MRGLLISGESRALRGAASDTGPSTSGAKLTTAQSDTHLAISPPASESDCDGVDNLDRLDDRESREDDEGDDAAWTRSGTGVVVGSNGRYVNGIERPN